MWDNGFKTATLKGDANMNNTYDAKKYRFFTQDDFNQNKSSSKANGEGAMINMENNKATKNINVEKQNFDKNKNNNSEPQRVTIIRIYKKDGIFLVGAGDAIFTSKGYKIIGKKTFKWKILDSNPLSVYKYAYTVLGEKLSKVANHKHRLNYILTVNSQIAIKYFMALKAVNEGMSIQEAAKILATMYGLLQKELVKSATFFLEAIVKFKETSGKSIFLEDYIEYFCEPLIIADEVDKELLYDGMPLNFKKDDCINVPGVSFMKKYHTQDSIRELKIYYKIEYAKDGSKIKTPLKYMASMPCDTNGVPKSERGAFMKMLHDILEELLPKVVLLSEEEQEEIFDEYFN